jgi:hypothetical protein
MPINPGELTAAQKKLLLTLIVLIGALLRLIPQAIEGVDLPFRSGGLFLEFAHQIRIHHYRLPKTIPFYTTGGIPFAYPPLAFYLEALVLAIFPLSSFMIANLLPPFIAIISVAAVYPLTSALKLRPEVQLASVLAYATIPSAFLQQVESAGLAEAMGVLSLILFSYTLAKANHTEQSLNYALTGVTWALCVVSSPGTAFGSTLMFLAFALLKSISAIRNQTIPSTIWHLVLSGLMALSLSSPYWLTVTVNHGFGIFFESLQAQQKSLSQTILRLVAFNVTGGAIQFWWNALIFGGILWTIRYQRLELLLWLVILYSIPREGGWMVAIPISVLAGIGIAEMLGSFITKQQINKVVYILVWFCLLFYIIANPLREIKYFAQAYSRQEWAETMQAMDWGREHLPPDSSLVVLSDGKKREWAPHRIRRTVLNVDQGTEWVPAENEQITDLNGKLNRCTDLTCIANEIRPLANPQTTYLLLSKNNYGHLYQASSTGAQPIWENNHIAIGPILPPK